ncbi:MAG TPA: PilZ domain-containing protein [Actinomycetota bacterium]|nr:PilZ domain-containing protein [Actinomycetota bacterium]
MATAPATPRRRAAPRGLVQLPLTFARAERHGKPVSAHTIDLSAGGARVCADRPLKVDEVLRFDLCCEGDVHVSGECRVLREHPGRTYAVRFERLDGDDAANELSRLALAAQPG